MASYPDLPNPDLLDRIPRGARVVLDVGCSTGALGAVFKRFSPRTRVLGIDRNAEAASLAATRLDAVAVGDVEADPFPFPDEAVDCIVYGDVLEHLRDPWALVRRHMERLSPDGTILICLPNVEHWSFAARLMQGTWRYEESGLLDQTHMRWFTLETTREALESLGLSPFDIHPRIFEAERADTFIDVLAPALSALGVTKEQYRARALPLQYVWRVQKARRQRLHVAATMLAPVGGVSHTRVVFPMQMLATDPTVTATMLQDRLPQTDPDTPKVIVLHRPVMTGDEALQSLRSLLADGWLIVTEFDDHPDFFPAMKNGETYSFSGAHAVQTSTRTLAAVLRPRNPEVAVFPNAIRMLPDAVNFADPRRMTLFFGAINREQDWAPLVGVLNDVASLVGDRLAFSIVHDRGLFDALETPHKGFEPTADYPRYMELLGQAEIALMPLADTAFNRAKSDLKFIEAGACRVAPLASRVVYAETAVDQETAMLFDDAAELRLKLLRMIALPEVARGIGDRARAYVAAERMLAYQTEDRIAWYRDLWSRRAALTEALYTRVPALRPLAAPALSPAPPPAMGEMPAEPFEPVAAG